MKPILLLDVDGVLALLPNAKVETTHHVVSRLPIEVPIGTHTRLATLKEAFTLTWCTAWNSFANEELGPFFGLDPLPICNWERFDKISRSTATSKLQGVKHWLGEDRPFAWIDDDLARDVFAWTKKRSGPSLLVPTIWDKGMTDKQVVKLLTWAETIKDDSPVPDWIQKIPPVKKNARWAEVIKQLRFVEGDEDAVHE